MPASRAVVAASREALQLVMETDATEHVEAPDELRLALAAVLLGEGRLVEASKWAVEAEERFARRGLRHQARRAERIRRAALHRDGVD